MLIAQSLFLGCASDPKSHNIELDSSWTRFGEDEFVNRNFNQPKRTQLDDLDKHYQLSAADQIRIKEVHDFDQTGKKSFWLGTAAMVFALGLQGENFVPLKTIATGVWGISWTIWLGSSAVSVGLLNEVRNSLNANEHSASIHSDILPTLRINHSF